MTTAIMYDDVSADNYPADSQLVAAYIDGRYDDFAAVAARFPTIVHVSITIWNGDADVLDIETGDATPEMAGPWVRRQKSEGKVAVCYCNLSNWDAVIASCAGTGVDGYWVADYDNDPTIPDEWRAKGCVAKQYQSTDAWDRSLVLDTWPNLILSNQPSHRETDVPAPLDIVRRLDCPTGGYWEQSYEGGIYAYGGAPDLGAYNRHPEWHNAPRGFYDLVPCGKGYTQVSTIAGEHYDFPR